MHTYTLTAAGYAAQKQRAIIQSLAIYGTAGLAGLAAANRGDFSSAGLIGLAIGLPAVALLVGLMLWSGLRAHRSAWESYRLTLDSDALSRQLRGKELSIRRDDVTQIEEYPGAGLMVRTTDRQWAIFIPIGLEAYETVHAQLAEWRPFTTKQNQRQLLIRCLLWALVGIGGVVIPTTTHNVWVAVLVGGPMLVLMIWIAIRTQRNRDALVWQKAFYWLGVVLIAVMVATRIQTLR